MREHGIKERGSWARESGVIQRMSETNSSKKGGSCGTLGA